MPVLELSHYNEQSKKCLSLCDGNIEESWWDNREVVEGKTSFFLSQKL